MKKTKKEEVLEQMARKYKKRPITDIEEDIKGFIAAGFEAVEARTHRLFYLLTTNRWRENKRYAKSTWDIYLWECFRLRPATFIADKEAFLFFSEKARKIGPAIIASIKRKCGVEKMLDVLSQIKDDMTSPDIQKVIDQFKKPALAKAEKKNWRALVVRKDKIIQDLRQELYEKDALVKERDAQIARLKTTVMRLEKELEDLLKKELKKTQKAIKKEIGTLQCQKA